MKTRSLLLIFICLSSFSFQANAASKLCGVFFFELFCSQESRTAARNANRGAQPRNALSQTEGRFDPNCVDCRANALRVGSLQPLPNNNPASGFMKVMQNMYRTCNIGTLNRLPDYPSYTCNVASSYSQPSAAIACSGDQESTRAVVIQIVGEGGTLNRRINSSYRNAYQASNQCSAVVDGVNYATAKKSFAMPSNFGVTVQGGRPVINLANCGVNRAGQTGTCNIASGSVPTIAPECYKMIQVGYLSNCLKMHPDERVTSSNGEMRLNIGGSNKWVNTRLGVSLAEDPNSCLAEPKVNLGALRTGANPKEPLLEGDAIIDGGNHSWMVTKVGNDPLGIRGVLTSGRDCSSITINDMNMEVGQSTGSRDAGPVIVNVSSAYSERNLPNGSVRAPIPKLLAYAKRLCATAKANPTGLVKSSDLSSRDFAITRHKTMMGNGAPQCRYDADTCPKVQGDECGKACHRESVSASLELKDISS